MNTIHIRKAVHEDLRVLQEIARETISKSYRAFLGDDLVDWFINSGESDKELEKQLPYCDVLLVDVSIAAFAIYFDDRIHLMMVDASLHRNGLGSKLLSHVEKQLFEQGHPVIRVETFESNQQATNFYKKNNWSIVREEKDDQNGFVRIYFDKHALK